MERDDKAARARSFVLGGLLGASAVLAAWRPGKRRPEPAERGPALAPFEEAPCYRERVEAEAREGAPR